MTHFLMQTILLPNSEPIESDLLARAVISKHEQTSDKSEQLYTFLRRIFSEGVWNVSIANHNISTQLTI